ncbi:MULTISPECIES: GNAT family N-acetyltransferase [Flavobacteriaceae]|uniref:GNAT family N-acetyltransferase n=1 Tax=Flavobacteriaceae TaxID=49546 RepID=UPI0014926A5E|nr:MULTISPECIES: GNAT family N-acetyltransferase [Allomuricauda]MDC6365378.1 GNAT family N-acetyltransferase [Muricauda sp. AC10]
MLSYKQASTKNELEQILALQQVNLFKSLSSKEREKEGFLTVEHNLDTLTAMNKECGHIIALQNNHVVGYALCMHPKFSDSIEVLKPMFAEINKVIKGSKSNYMVMGQVCIAKSHRGLGVFRNLYHTMKNCLPEGFDKIITEVDTNNIRSMNAHKAIGFKELSQHRVNETIWSIIALQ